jgi:glycosyltransferase involved in cell wall biosynthesis
MRLDAFVDLTSAPIQPADLARLVSYWRAPESLGSIAERVVIGLSEGSGAILDDLPPGWSAVRSQSPVAALSDAMLAAGLHNRLLLVLIGPVMVPAEAPAILAHDLSDDPMFGSAIARIGCRCGRSVLSSPRNGVGPAFWMPRKVLAPIKSDILPESVSACTLIGAAVLRNFDALDSRFSSAAGALLHCLADARRRGFRTVRSNRSLVMMDGLDCGREQPSVVSLPNVDAVLLGKLIPEFQRVSQQGRSASLERFECLSARVPSNGRIRPSLLIDVRNVVALFNGTSQATLGLAESLHRLGPDWDVTLLANQQGAEFHRLEANFPGWPVRTSLPERGFDVALRPTQPWQLQDLIDLHCTALVNIYLMLDTIAWDIAHLAQNLDEVWWFLARHADAIWFDSEFTRRRFRRRFPVECPAADAVVHFSFDPAEYRHSGSAQAAEEGAMLVVGNSHYHKDVPRTVETLAAAFPFRPIKVLGPSPVTSAFVESVSSGGLSDRDVHRLYARAGCVIFPSFYEGFGFPIVTALAYGRPVFARRSELVDELAEQSANRGRLFVFDRRDELVDLLGGFLHGEAVPSVPLGGAVSGDVRAWHDVAEQVTDLLQPYFEAPVGTGWFERERAVRQLQTYRVP